MSGCPCEPNGTDGLTCPDKDGRLLCQTSPSRAGPSADAVANAFWHAVAYAKLGDVTAQQFVNSVIERARKAPEARAGDCDAHVRCDAIPAHDWQEQTCSTNEYEPTLESGWRKCLRCGLRAAFTRERTP